MKYVKQFWIILLFCALGEGFRVLLPLPIPASVYGLILLLVALLTGSIKLERVEETADFLVEIMPVMFIPAGVGLLTAWGVLQPIWLPVVVITILTTVIVMVVTGRVTQFVIRKDRRKTKK
ncbi:MAG: CidA/LrgA family protein [Blautia sp.]|nr:CidA/LrgA family protein [Blautia sp.]MDD7729820.1 CidA/LrgA family protein [Clostridia bacterium]MDY5664370.1 CidA/LrgA family protein [Blautia sp.]